LVFVIGVVLLPPSGTVTAFDWSGVSFFGACAVACLWRLVHPRPRLVIDQHGVTAGRLGHTRIRWEDVRRAYLRSFFGHPYLCIDVEERETYVKRLSVLRRVMSRANRVLVPADLAVPLVGVDARPDEIVGRVRQLSERRPGAEQGAASDATRR
jgi:hypothetical protein